MIFYVSHNYAAKYQTFLPSFVEGLQEIGHECNSRWLQSKPGKGLSIEDQCNAAMEDLLDVSSCDYLIHFSDQVGITEGRGKFIEVGYGLAVGKKILVVGESCNESVFYMMKNVRRFKEMTELIKFIEGLPKEV